MATTADARAGVDADASADVDPSQSAYALFRCLRPIQLPLGGPHELVRVGGDNDGGYVVLWGTERNVYDAFISCGIGADVSFEDAMIKRLQFDDPSIVCRAYDGTIQHVPQCDMSARIWFCNVNIASANTERTTNLHDILHEYHNVLLKMDIEGAEFEWIESLSDEMLGRIRQIVIEIHNPWTVGRRLSAVRKLLKIHHVVHFHANNFGGTASLSANSAAPGVFELTLVRRTDVVPCSRGLRSATVALHLPSFADRPNNPLAPDHKVSFEA